MLRDFSYLPPLFLPPLPELLEPADVLRSFDLSTLCFTIWTFRVFSDSFSYLAYKTSRKAMSNAVPTGKRIQKEWKTPVTARPALELCLQNSLTRQKEPFMPNEGRRVKWYLCGPTVYDSSHMGHARTYLSQDILRRIMTDYFGYNVQFIMNITDIDDKIIKRARQRHLLTKYFNDDAPDVKKVCEDVIEALEHFKPKWQGETDTDKRVMLDKMMAKVESSSKELKLALSKGDVKAIDEAKASVINDSRDVVSDWLDAKYGKGVTEHAVFDNLAKTFENEFFADMARLNVLPPDVLTRVSEYVPEIVDYVQKIIDNKYGYATEDGDVYFDTKAFEADPKHFYAKLVPEAYGDADQLEKNMREGEGELSITAEKLRQKRNPNDFALWKSSKAGEPFWPSPWGNGRPGWHIECSAMASAICGSKLDIHAGGFDLKFPHHDNEIAQVEAHYDDPHWVNYFLHCGTLRIQGMKMSKSLKNFITIRQALKDYSARQLRLLFLMHNWADVLDYSTSTMERAIQFEKFTNEFFQGVKHHLRQHFTPGNGAGFVKFDKKELEFLEKFGNIQEDIHTALCDSIDTRTVVEKMRELVGLGNVYINEKEKASLVPNCNLIRNIATYVTNLLRTFGVITGHQEIGYPLDESSNNNATSEELLMPYLNALAAFRDNIRNIAKADKLVSILQECDKLRDDTMPELGVRLEDRNGPTCVKLEDRATLLRERAQKEEAEKQKAKSKEEEKERKVAEAAKKDAAKRIPPTEMFKQDTHLDEYSQWDDKGIPTHTKDGVEITKSQRKKLEKLWLTQEKVYKASTPN